jgi:hypothetical protein
MFFKLLIISVIFLSLAAIGFGVSMLLKTNGRFPETHVSRNPEMRKRGISCAQKTDVGCNPTDDFPGCASCGEKDYLI